MTRVSLAQIESINKKSQKMSGGKGGESVKTLKNLPEQKPD